MKQLLALVFLAILTSVVALAGINHGTIVFSQGFFPLKVGPGGQLTGLDVGADGNMIVRMDTFGVWVWDQAAPYCGNSYVGAPSTGCWRDTLTYAALGSNGVFTFQGVEGGAYEVAIGKVSSQNLYMQWGQDGCFYSSADYGHTWTKQTAFATAFSGTCPLANPNGAGKLTGRHMAVDPANDSILFGGTRASSAYFTLNGGTSFTVISTGTLPAGTSTIGQIFAFDPHSSVSGGATQGIWECSFGTGCYYSSNGGSLWTLSAATNNPANAIRLVVDRDGDAWVVNASNGSNGALWVLPQGGAAWIEVTSISTTRITTVAIDPNPSFTGSSTHVVAIGLGGAEVDYTTALTVATPNSATWISSAIFGSCVASPPVSPVQGNGCANDVPWLNFTNEGFMTVGDVQYNTVKSTGAASNSQLVFGEGIGFWQMVNPYSFSAGAHTQWTSQSAPIQQLVTNWITTPWVAGSHPIVLSWDRPEFAPDTVNWPSIHGLTTPQTYPIILSNAADWASSNPAVIVGFGGGQGHTEAGVSTDGGQTFPTSFVSTLPTPASGGAFNQGAIAASSSLVWLMEIGGNGGLFSTNDAGATWNQQAIAPTDQSFTIPYNDAGWYSANQAIGGAKRQNLCADRVNYDTGVGSANGNGTLYAWNKGTTHPGLYVSADSGSTWQTIQLGYFNAAAQASQAQMRCVPGVANDIIMTQGQAFGAAPLLVNYVPNVNQPLTECKKTTGTWGCSAITSDGTHNILEAWGFGFGKASPTSTTGFPSIYLYGWVWNAVSSAYNVAFYRIDNYSSTTHTGTVTMLGCSPATWNIGCAVPENVDQTIALDGDPNVYGKFYYGREGSGTGMGQFNFLFKRDIDPANDNIPMFLNEVG